MKKFRLWDDDNLKFFDFDFSNLEKAYQLLSGWESYHYSGYFRDHPEYIQQFTGRYDKNKKEMYEGDFIKVKNDFGEGVALILDGGYSFYANPNKISFDSESGLIFGSPEGEHWQSEDSEIIGNIIENPELVKVK